MVNVMFHPYIDSIFYISFRRVNWKKRVNFLVLVSTRHPLREKTPSVSGLNCQLRGETPDVPVFS